MVEGSAQPDEVAAFERAAQERAARMSRALADLTEDLLDHRNEPLMVSGMWGLHWGLLENARARGVRDGTFNGGSYINGAGGNKGDALPPDFKQQVLRFYANAQPANLAYGMTEMMLGLQLCEADRYHAPPWLILVPLDRNGEQALPQDGIVQSRLGFLDLMLTSRWGGVISGDKVTMDFSPTCSCGRPGPVILPEITRFTDVGDDKITCAGAFEVYVRGMVE
jgi:hypothetical protein